MTEKIKLISSTKNGKYTLTELTHSDPNFGRAKEYDCENGGIEEGYELYVKTKDKEYSIATDPKSGDYIGKGVKLCTYAEPVVVKFYIGIPEGVSGSTPDTGTGSVPAPSPAPGPALAPPSSASASVSASAPVNPESDSKTLSNEQIKEWLQKYITSTIWNTLFDNDLYTELGSNTIDIIAEAIPFDMLDTITDFPKIRDFISIGISDYNKYIQYYLYIIARGLNFDDREWIKINIQGYSQQIENDTKYHVVKFDDRTIQNVMDAWKSKIMQLRNIGGSRNISSRYNYMFNKTQYKLL